MVCEHDWVSSGVAFGAGDRIHMVHCTVCDAADPHRRESEGHFRTSVLRSVIEYARRGNVEMARTLYDLFYERLGKQVGSIPLREESVILVPVHMVAYGVGNTCDIPDAYNYARSVGLKLADILMDEKLYTQDSGCECGNPSPLSLSNTAGNLVVEVERPFIKGKNGQPDTFGALTINVPHEVYEYVRYVAPQNPRITETIIVDAKMGRVLARRGFDWSNKPVMPAEQP